MIPESSIGSVSEAFLISKAFAILMLPNFFKTIAYLL